MPTGTPDGPGLEPLSDRQRSVMGLLESPSFELVPTGTVHDQIDLLPAGARVTVTASPKRGLEPTLHLAVELQRRGFQTVPHLAARSVTDGDHLRSIVELLAHHGIGRVFVVAGDNTTSGPFADGVSLIRAIEDLGARPEIGIPAYPGGHPFLSEGRLLKALQAKEPYASYMTTQMCFDGDQIARWVTRVRAEGIALPVRIGLPGVASIRKLAKMSAQIGVGESVRFLARHAGLLRRLTGRDRYRPDGLILSMAESVGTSEAGVTGFHIYTFNQVRETEAWRTRWLARPDG